MMVGLGWVGGNNENDNYFCITCCMSIVSTKYNVGSSGINAYH